VAGSRPQAVLPRGQAGRLAQVGTRPLAAVCLHGAGADHTRWLPLMEELEDALALDLPGHGEAPLPLAQTVAEMAWAVLQWLRSAGLCRPLLVGHSMGGAVALKAAFLAQEEGFALGGLGLLATGARLPVHPAFLEAARRGEVHPTFAQGLFGPRAPWARREQEVSSLAAAASRGALSRDLQACQDFDVRGQVGKLLLPAVAAVGAWDVLTPLRRTWELVPLFAHPSLVEVTVVEGVGHFLPVEAPREVAQALRDLRRRAAGR
jgi:pimeloyl-ACP methyl ester carboxylesterase